MCKKLDKFNWHTNLWFANLSTTFIAGPGPVSHTNGKFPDASQHRGILYKPLKILYAFYVLY